MAKFTIVIVDEDEWYNNALKTKLVHIYQNQVRVLQYTNESCFMNMFAQPVQIDILIISHALYSEELEKYPITFTMILCENFNEEMESSNRKRVCRYAPIKHLLMQMIPWIYVEDGKKECSLIMVYGPAGGSGKTTTAVGISAALTKKHKRVVYINTCSQQDFGHLFCNCKPMTREQERMIVNDSISKEYFLGLLGEDIFFFVKPFSSMADNYGFSADKFFMLARKLAATRRFDYIVLDTSSELTAAKTSMMSACDYVILITEQTESAKYKFDRLMENIDISNIDKFKIVCNKYSQNENDYLTGMLTKRNIPLLLKGQADSVKQIAQSDKYEQITYDIIK